jgi:predicted ABC-type transport system involved in lysophospholipase L1 biosynthesis ATPase subunit
VLDRVGLGGRLGHKPRQLSGGEQQRVAVARAIVHDPQVVLADEPSGNLDHRNSTRLHELLFALARERRAGFVVVTHNRELAAETDRCLLLEDGLLHAA